MRRVLDDDFRLVVVLTCREGRHDRRDRNGRRRGNQSRRQDIAHRVGNGGAKDAAIDHHDRAGNPGHAAAHQGEELAALHFCEIGSDEDGRLDHADEKIDRRARAERAADADGPAQHEGHAADDFLHHAPVEQQGGQGADHENEREDLEGEDERRAFRNGVEGQGRSAQIAEYEGCPCFRRAVDGADAAGERRHEGACGRKFQQQHGKRDLQRDAGRHGAPGHGAPILGEKEGEAKQAGEGEKPVQNMHRLSERESDSVGC